MKKTIGFLLFIAFGFLMQCSQKENDIYLFSYFKDNGQDGLHLAYSYDGLKWHALKNDQSFLTPQIGNAKLMRDPCILLDADDTFHMVWTVSWWDKGIGYASSKDLINWSEQKFIPVMEHEPDAKNCWAPEIFYDDQKDQYLIFWATTIPGRFPDTDFQSNSGKKGEGTTIACTMSPQRISKHFHKQKYFTTKVSTLSTRL